ncbi:MAG: hypothetical protein HY530_07780 [Chloroflexi bacterium]|nr:hypothetical protein [Chloroflexota bacterium]
MTEDKNLIGVAGQYYVAFRLAARGYAVGITPRGTTSVDLIVANPETGKSVTIQTKTGRKALYGSEAESWWKWPVSVSRRPQKAFLFTFVDLKGDSSQTPDVFIVPSDKVSPPLLQEYRVGSWFVIEREEDTQKYLDRWQFIDDALA